MSPKFICFCCLVISLFGCKPDKPLIRSAERLADISRMLQVQKELTRNCQVPIWNIFDQSMTANEKMAMQFMYAYMPLSDMADYSPSFFLAAVKQSLKAREEMPWSKSVPEDLFLHYVLPLRVNNENLDSFRIRMYDEIKGRIKGLEMAEAALEINHWCHEKVIYHGTDSRTSSPLSTIKKAFGRCGEETTFTVAAMRAAFIPARQVYVPRWAHVDDNHAWVEVWINGKWNYMGACEPEPALNMGWFSEPSRRAMLVHTRVYGRYFGNDEVIEAEDRFSELNLTASYAPVKKLTVVVRNKDGRPADSAGIAFCLYNYAEFYPIARKFTDNNGIGFLTTGLGDLWVWASQDGWFDYQIVRIAETDTLYLTLNKSSIPSHTELSDLVPPHAIKTDTVPGENKRWVNLRKLAREDSIRSRYVATFRDSAWSAALALRLHLDTDTVVKIMGKTYGNWPELTSYLTKNVTAFRNTVLALALQLSDKDLSDAKEAILTDHIRHTEPSAGPGRDIFEKWILSPRIGNENLSPWRSFLEIKMKQFAGLENMASLISWINTHIALDDKANMHSRSPLTPIGVYNLRVADHVSRDIFYVATCRSLNIPARLNPVTGLTEYFSNGKWIKVSFDKTSVPQTVTGHLELTRSPGNMMPAYYTHFTLSQFTDGFYRTLEFDEGRKLSDFPVPLDLDTGQYLLVTGNRLEDGTVLSSQTFFHIKKDQRLRIRVFLRVLPDVVRASGKLDLAELKFSVAGGSQSENLTRLFPDSKLILILLDPDQEPSKHVLDELGQYAGHFNQWKGHFIFVMPQQKTNQTGMPEGYKLPAGNLQGYDAHRNILNSIEAQYGKGLGQKLPLVLLCDQDGRVYFFSAGYRIGLGERLFKLTQ